MSKIIGTVFFLLMMAAIISRATGHHELTNQFNTYAKRMATATAQSAASPYDASSSSR
jgi:hypothetical protein